MNATDSLAVQKILGAVVPVILYRATPPNFDTTFIGGAITRDLGFAPDEFLGDTWVRHVHEDDLQRIQSELHAALVDKDNYCITYRFWNRGHTTWRWFEDRGIINRDEAGVPKVAYGAMIDVSETRALMESLRESESRYRHIFESHPAPLWVYDTQTLRFITVNEAALKQYGYTRDEFAEMTILDIRPPHDHERLKAEVAKAPTGLYDAGLWTHQRKGGESISVRILSHEFEQAGRKAELVMAIDVTDQLRDTERARKAEADLLEALQRTIEVLAAAGEQRDPYTAGHQRRVAQLAVAIGHELGLDKDRLDGLRLAASIHDIGKIAVPTEILAMPRRLIDVERLLVNRHCTIGSGLLKDVKLPWPIADAILHHHERLDGSGYPDALQGDQISMEARIIGLADTVEAMSNHRPYRAGLGIDVALEEIQRGRGTKYDAEAVDVCVALFRESGFKFTDPPA